MSTRSSTHFHDADGTLAAIVFRHTDGYPSGAGKDLQRFIAKCKALPDGRLNDATMLAARYVVFLAGEFDGSPDNLGFLSVRVMMEDSGDIEYRYHVYCNGVPRVTVQEVGGPEMPIAKAIAQDDTD